MKLQYCHLPNGNFGDDLNPLLWGETFGPMVHAPQSVELWGVGTLLGKIPHTGLPKVVLGTGGRRSTGKLHDPLWDVRWVRGPLTASRLGLPPDKGLGDAAILWSGLQEAVGPDAQGPVGLVTHWKTGHQFDWGRVARDAGLQLIDPTQSPIEVAQQLRQCSRVLTESLHGAIFADTLGIPWAPVILAHRFEKFKWCDWLATIGRDFAPFVMDRPLVDDLRLHKAVSNRLARILRVSYKAARPQLRPVRIATAADVRQVTQQLRAFAGESGRYGCSSEAAVQRQRRSMLQACERTAEDYGVEFLKNLPA